ncbi:hypothetical protein EZI54_04550 [Marinobacter halodurans]|uniref:Uncharacterized protein n=1 Tax=Marinobacter halodurans TaxID=2528979 RepID=A0ABY1ZNI2_9GAMM|nr:hypothetical protein [Marinobacter halodurans]TBW58128.1 hypothetical protein EZI54_04550 [Marinobacter halodurans]
MQIKRPRSRYIDRFGRLTDQLSHGVVAVRNNPPGKDNFNTIEFMLGDMMAELELPFEPMMPFTPAPNRHRMIHPNKPENS